MNNKMMLMLMAMAMTIAQTGCSTIAEKTNFTSDEALKSQAAGAIGYSPADLTVLNRRTEGTNTYVVVKAKDNKEFACVINGGNLLTMGMTNPPTCNKK